MSPVYSPSGSAVKKMLVDRTNNKLYIVKDHFGSYEAPNGGSVENDIIKVFYLNGTRFELLNSKNLHEFLNKKKKIGYPYFFINKKYFKNAI